MQETQRHDILKIEKHNIFLSKDSDLQVLASEPGKAPFAGPIRRQLGCAHTSVTPAQDLEITLFTHYFDGSLKCIEVQSVFAVN